MAAPPVHALTDRAEASLLDLARRTRGVVLGQEEHLEGATTDVRAIVGAASVAAGLATPAIPLLVAGPLAASSSALQTTPLAIAALAAAVLTFPIVGAIARRDLPRRSAMLVASLVAAGGIAGTSVTTGAATLAAAAAAAVGAGIVVALLLPLAAEHAAPQARVRALAAVSAGGMLGLSLGAGLVGLAIHRDVTVSLALGASAAALAALALPGALLAERGHDDEHAVRANVEVASGLRDPLLIADPTEPTSELPALGDALRRLWGLPTFVAAAWGAAGAGVAWAPVLADLVGRLERDFDAGAIGTGSVRTAAVLGAAPLLGLVALMAMAKSLDQRWRTEPGALGRAAGVSLLLAAGGLVLGAAAPWSPLSGAAIAYALAAVAVGQVVLVAVVVGCVPVRLRSHATGLLVAAGGAGTVAGFSASSALLKRQGPGAALVVCAVLLVAASRGAAKAGRSAAADLDRTCNGLVESEALAVAKRSGRKVPMLACAGIDFSYGKVQVLFDVDLTVDDGEMVALLGTNGAGKSTLLKVISGLGIPSSGTVRYDGDDITYLPPPSRVAKGITQIPGGKAVFGPLTVAENLRMFGFSRGRDSASIKAGIEEGFAAFPRLHERRNSAAQVLSGGEQQMLALTKALILQPRVLLIDELSLGLAPVIVADLLQMVRRINAAGTSIVLVEQSVNVALSLVQHAYFMEKGAMRFDGAAAELVARPDLLRSVYLKGSGKGASA